MNGAGSRSRDRSAAAWVAREDRGALTQEDIQARDQWLQSDPLNLGAYVRMKAISRRFDRSRLLVSREHALPVKRSRWLPAAVATVAAAALAFLMLQSDRPVTSEFVTEVGEIRSVALADGSRLTLNAGTVAKATYARERRIELSRGEAIFNVRRDPTVPFVVSAGPNEVVAVGTTFSVRREGGDDMRVVVTEGAVDVMTGDTRLARLTANHMLDIRGSSVAITQRLSPIHARQKHSWVEGFLTFDGISLADAANEFSRHAAPRLIISEASVAQLKIVGRFPSHDPEGFARTVSDSLGITYRVGPDGIHLLPPPTNVPSSPTSMEINP